MRTMAWAVTLVLASGTLFAQEPAERPDGAVQDDEAAADDAAVRPEPLHKIRVLQHPYDLASFYRSHQGEGLGDADYTQRYPIASFYRSRQTNPYRDFWASGYGAAGYGAQNARGRSLFRRRIGENGDLFLFAPFLAPVGPLSGAFLEPW
jgi:hypothetical protein